MANDEQWGALVDAMLDADLLDLLLSNLSRLDEKDERDQEVYHAMSVLENLCSREAMAKKIGGDEKLLRWLIGRAQSRESEVSQNKQYTVEMVAILAQSARENKDRLVELGAVDTVLQLAAAYRKRDPDSSGEEEEYMANLFEILTALVDRPEGKAKFVEAEGVELCLIMLKEGGASKPCALRLLNHATGGSGHEDTVCKQIVGAGGLKPTFTMFMKTNDTEAVEHLLGIFLSMLRRLPANSGERIRTLAKFVEKDYGKLVRLLSLREGYAARLANVKPEAAFADEDEGVPARRAPVAAPGRRPPRPADHRPYPRVADRRGRRGEEQGQWSSSGRAGWVWTRSRPPSWSSWGTLTLRQRRIKTRGRCSAH